jgi:hypothetical protein
MTVRQERVPVGSSRSWLSWNLKHSVARQLRPFFFAFGALLPDGKQGSGTGDCLDALRERPSPVSIRILLLAEYTLGYPSFIEMGSAWFGFHMPD